VTDTRPTSASNGEAPADEENHSGGPLGEGDRPAGEEGRADASTGDRGTEVIVGAIPDTEDLSHMLWTARCTAESHGLLGHFETREAADEARAAHLAEHAGTR
jgi:hypothetical protein